MWFKRVLAQSCYVDEHLLSQFMSRAGMFIHDASNVAQKYISSCEASRSLYNLGHHDFAIQWKNAAESIARHLERFVFFMDRNEYMKAKAVLEAAKEKVWALPLPNQTRT